MNVKTLREEESLLDVFDLLLNLNLTKIFKLEKYLELIFDVFKSKLGSEREKNLKFRQFVKEEETVLESSHLYKLKILLEMQSLSTLKPYIKDEFRQIKLAPLKLFDNFGETFFDF